MAPNLLETIGKKTKDEWQQLFVDYWTDTRIWIQENGELAAVAALIAGIVLVLAFKLIVICLVIAAVVGGVVWYLAPTESSSLASDTHHSHHSFNGPNSNGDGDGKPQGPSSTGGA